MKGKVILASEISGRILIETNQTFKVCDKNGVESDGNTFSVGMKTLLIALAATPFGAILAAKCAGQPKDYDNVANVLVYLLCGAEIEFDRKKLNVGDKRSDGVAVEKPSYQTELKGVQPVADMNIFMQLLPMVTKRVTTTTAVNPFI